MRHSLNLSGGAQNATYKFMNVMAGNLPLYEEALRALYSRDRQKFEKLVSTWPKDIKGACNEDISGGVLGFRAALRKRGLLEGRCWECRCGEVS